ncbi:hypothetical protein BLOT_004879, partial [Blomia tropicalis]
MCDRVREMPYIHIEPELLVIRSGSSYLFFLILSPPLWLMAFLTKYYDQFRNRSFNSNSINSFFYFTNVGVFISMSLELYRLYSKSYIVHRLTTTDVA